MLICLLSICASETNSLRDSRCFLLFCQAPTSSRRCCCSIHAYIHTHTLHTYIHYITLHYITCTYITYIHTYITYIHTYIACIALHALHYITYIHTYIHMMCIYICMYIHTLHTYIHYITLHYITLHYITYTYICIYIYVCIYIHVCLIVRYSPTHLPRTLRADSKYCNLQYFCSFRITKPHFATW